MNQHTRSDYLYVLGDGIDGEYMLEKEQWGFGPWHGQVIASIIRKKEQGTQLTYIPGNHDSAIREQTILDSGMEKSYRNLCGKNLFGIQILAQAFHQTNGGFIKLSHGDENDGANGHYSPVGTKALGLMGYIDTFMQTVNDNLSIAVTVKRFLQKIGVLDLFIRNHHSIAAEIDGDPTLCAKISGHTHGSGIRRTPMGKLMINDGSCTEHVEACVQDANGTFALIEWHYSGIQIQQENKPPRFYKWKELGLAEFTAPPLFIQDASTAKADRLVRLIYRTWPPKER